jgi:hypothetical protein
LSTIIKLVVLAALGTIAFFGAVVIASETAGEVVTLRTYREDGLATETSLWVVEDRGVLYLRAGSPDSGWLERLQANPDVELVRGGEMRAYKASIAQRMGPQINARMAEKYGWGDTLVGLMRDDAGVTAVRLDRVRR